MHFYRSMPLLFGSLLLVAACRKSAKEPAQPPFQHRSLGEVEVKYLKPYSLDINEEGEDEVYFTVGLVNDTEGTHGIFVAVSLVSAKILAGEDSVVKLDKGGMLPLVPDYPQQWNSYSNFMCELLLPAANPADTTWRGAWVAADRKYLGVQFREGDQEYIGWVSASIDTAGDRMVLHECAWRPLKAGAIRAGDK